MRLDELLQNRHENITEEQYRQLKTEQVFIIEYSEVNGWNFAELEHLTEAQARRLLQRYRKAQTYETENHIAPPIREVVVSMAAETDHPEWPEGLKAIDMDHLFAAYLQHKFNITF